MGLDDAEETKEEKYAEEEVCSSCSAAFRFSQDDESPASPSRPVTKAVQPEPENGPDDPNSTLPMARYNAMMAVQRNSLYM